MPFMTNLRQPAIWLALSHGTIALLVLAAGNLIISKSLGEAYRADGMLHLVNLWGMAIGLLAMFVVARLILARQRKTGARYRALVENVPDPICCWLPDTSLTYVNERYAELFGIPPSALLGRRWLELVAEADRERIRQLVADLVASLRPSSSTHRVDRDRHTIAWMEWTDIPVVDGKGRLLYVQSIGRDISERVRDQEKLRKSHLELERANRELAAAMTALSASQQQVIHQERLRALGQMASGIAHDFNNALSVIYGFSEMLHSMDGQMAPDKRRKYLEMIRTAAKDATAVVNRMREFYRHREAHDEVSVIDLNALADQVIELTRPRWESQAQANGVMIRVERKLTASRRIAGCESELREAMINLIGNAVDAMPQGGILTIRTADCADMVAVEVIDNGTGMSQETVKKCIEPFFSTKGVRGTGLGLATVNGTIRRHQGRLEIRSQEGGGTSMIMQFPAMKTPVVDKPTLSDTTVYYHRGTPVLLVDDNELVRLGLQTTLTDLGFRVTAASSGRQALALYEQGLFAAVITDLAMPDMNGKELIGAIRRHNPRQPILMLTGFGEFMHEADEDSGADLLLSKPVEAEALSRSLAQLIGTLPGRACSQAWPSVQAARDMESRPAASTSTDSFRHSSIPQRLLNHRPASAG